MWVWSRIVGLSSYMQAFSRALALVLIGFALLNVAAGMRFDGWHANGWWIATSLPLWVERMLIPGLLLCLLPWALFSSSGWGGVARVWLARLCVAGLGLLVVGNVFQVLQLWWSGWIELRTVLIFSVLVLMWLGVIGLGLVADKPGRSAGSSQTGRARGGWLALPLCAAILVVGFPLGQAFSLGRTDYRRPVPVAVVLGAKAHPDGRPSDALRDRVMTAVELYHQGLVEKLVFSGGPTGRLDAQARAAGPEAYNLNPDEIDEPRAMRMLAVRHGVPEEAIVLDHHGWNTRLTARQVAVMMEQAGVGDFQVIAVSHDFHLPRIKMAFEQEGLGVLTVPARERYMLRRKPMLVAREVPAFWAYWLGLGR